MYPRYVRLYNCTRERGTLEFLFFTAQILIFKSKDQAAEGFQGAGSPEAKRRICLALEVTLQRYVKSNCIRSMDDLLMYRKQETGPLMRPHFGAWGCPV